jgi:fatty-acyl-CoA synthase
MKTLMEIFHEASLELNNGVHFWNLNLEKEFFSYQELFKKAQLLAHALQLKGLAKGDRIVIMMNTHPDFIISFFGTILAGGVPCAFYPPLRLGKIEEWKERTVLQFNSIEAKFALTQSMILGPLSALLKEVKNSPQIFQVKELLNLIDQKKFEKKSNQFSMDDLAFIQFSSGTTARPHPVMITHRILWHNINAITEHLPLSITSGGCVSWLPLYHDMGLVGCLISGIYCKTPLHLIPSEYFLAKPKLWLDVITLTRAQMTVAPNFAFGLCVNKIKEEHLKDLDLSSLKIVLCGAEMVHPPTLKKFAEFFAKVGFQEKALSPVYGLAEMTLAATFSPMNEGPLYTFFHQEDLETKGIAREIEEADSGPQVELTSLGQPLKDIFLEIRSENNENLPDNHLGHLWLKGPSMMKGYFNQPFDTGNVILGEGPDQWLRTGDKGFIHKGNLYIFGREKDILIFRGRNLDPSFIESAVNLVQGVRKGSVVATSDFDPVTGTEKLIILAELNERKIKGQKDQSLKKIIHQKILESCQISMAELVFLKPGTLPRTSSGKIQRGKAKELWKKGKLQSPSKWIKTIYWKENLIGKISRFSNQLMGKL